MTINELRVTVIVPVYNDVERLTVCLDALAEQSMPNGSYLVKVVDNNSSVPISEVVKRYGFAGRPASHGHPMSRNPGSMGPGTDPSRVIKGKKLPGRMGGKRASISNLKVVQIDEERNLLFIKGGVPGSRNSYLMIQK